MVLFGKPFWTSPYECSEVNSFLLNNFQRQTFFKNGNVDTPLQQGTPHIKVTSQHAIFTKFAHSYFTFSQGRL